MTRPKLDVTKCNINLYACDKAKLEQTFGYGWTEKVREAVHDYCNRMKVIGKPMSYEEWAKIIANQIHAGDYNDE